MKKRIEILLLDLDNTLWDFDANANNALEELFHRHHLQHRTGNTATYFIEEYKKINKRFWEQYEKGEISKDFLRTERFTEVFRKMGIPDSEHPENVWEEYLEICPVMTQMVDGAWDLLDYFKSKVKMGLITNGFQRTQEVKIKSTGIDAYIDFMVTSESTGWAKPDVRIFEKALELANAEPSAALYIGDTYRSDIVGAHNAQIDAILYDHLKTEQALITDLVKPVYTADSLSEVLDFVVQNYQF